MRPDADRLDARGQRRLEGLCAVRLLAGT
jgi:hypothetical protein